MFSDELEKISWEETTKAIYSKTDADVRRALGKKEHLDVNDFMALISPAAAPYLEVMARLSQKYTLERFGKTISMFVTLYLTNSCTNSCVYCDEKNHSDRGRDYQRVQGYQTSGSFRESLASDRRESRSSGCSLYRPRFGLSQTLFQQSPD